jgi:hypothetical protein
VLHDCLPRHPRQHRGELEERLAIALVELIEEQPAAGVDKRPEHLFLIHNLQVT